MQSARQARQLSRALPASRWRPTWRAPAARAASTALTAPPTTPRYAHAQPSLTTDASLSLRADYILMRLLGHCIPALRSACCCPCCRSLTWFSSSGPLAELPAAAGLSDAAGW